MNPVLLRQLRRALGCPSDAEVPGELQRIESGDPESISRLASGLPALLKRVGETYDQNERDLALRSRSLEISSQELSQANERLRAESKAQSRAIDSLRRTADEILRSMGREGLVEAPGSLDDLAELMSLLVSERGRFQNELELRQKELAETAERAQAASNAKSEFLATMSHEIRTPMNGILGMADLLLGGALESLQRRRMDVLRSSARTLLSILDDILDLSRLESGSMELERVPFDVDRLVRDVADLMEPPAKAAGIHLECHAAGGIRPVQGDPGRLRQVLFNLLGNAIKFTSKGSVAVRSVVSDVEGAMVLSVEVEDTGEGIPEAIQPRIFSPFTQADASNARRHGGTGLGLSICRKMVERMGGEIGFRSEFGKGSLFWFRVPLAVGADDLVEVDADAGSCPSPRGRAMRVLVVEDNPINQMVAQGMLESLGHSVRLADDGIAAEEEIVEADFDIILMDMQMPRRDGLEATRAIRGLGGAKSRTPIVALTANAMTGDREKCLEAGMDDYLTKPIDCQSLDEMIRRWTERGAESTPVRLLEPPARAEQDDRTRTTLVNALGSETVEMLESSFREQARDSLAKLHSAFDSRDASRGRDVVHALRGAALNLGYRAMGDALSRFEAILKDGRIPSPVETAELDTMVWGL